MFKEGDRVKLKRNCSGAYAGEIYTLTIGNAHGEQAHKLWAWKDGKIDEGSCGCSCHSNWELINLTAKELNKQNEI